MNDKNELIKVEGPDTVAVFGKMYWISPELRCPELDERVIVKYVRVGLHEDDPEDDEEFVRYDSFSGGIFSIEGFGIYKVTGWIYEPEG